MAAIDPELLRRATDGDRDAFWRLILPFRGLIYSVALGILKDEERAEDVLHETIVNAFRSLGNLRQPGRLPCWLYSMARNGAYDWMRKEKRMRRSLQESASQLPARPAPEERLEKEERLERMDAALGQLPEPFRVILALKYMNDYSCGEIGEILEITVSAVKSRLFEARKLLRKMMAATADGQEGHAHGLL